MKRLKEAHQQRERKEINKWKKSIGEDSRLKGKEYVTIKDKFIPAKKVQGLCLFLPMCLSQQGQPTR
jgi:hypothetical protein